MNTNVTEAVHAIVRRMPRPPADSPDQLQVAVLGAVGVGKSGFVIRLVTKQVVMTYDASIEDTYRQAITLPPGAGPMAVEKFATASTNASRAAAPTLAAAPKPTSAAMRKACT